MTLLNLQHTAALESAPHRVKGNTRSREQYHFHMENQVSICTPTDLGGMYVFTTTQWTDAIQECVAKVLGIPEARFVYNQYLYVVAYEKRDLYMLVYNKLGF